MKSIFNWFLEASKKRIYTREGTQKNLNYLLEGRPLALQASFTECSRSPCVHLHQCTSQHCCERMCSASVNFFLKTLSMCLPIEWWVISECTCPHYVDCSAVFDQKPHDPSAPPSLFTWSSPEWRFFVSLDKKSPQREMFWHCGRGETKAIEALKGIKINKFKNCLEQWKKCLNRCTASNGESLKMTEV